MKPPKSSKQRKTELKVRRRTRAAKVKKRNADDAAAFRLAVGMPEGSAPVNALLLAPNNSYGLPAFVKRGYYVSQHFVCKDCGKMETWTATQQKWWYEIAKGHVDAIATRCRPCRRKERERAAEHRKRTEEGIARKVALKAAGKWRTGR